VEVEKSILYSLVFGGPVALGGGLAFRSQKPRCLRIFFVIDPVIALIYFFLNLTVRMRLDRLDGLGGYGMGREFFWEGITWVKLMICFPFSNPFPLKRLRSFCIHCWKYTKKMSPTIFP
jgi:hypothetical protein